MSRPPLRLGFALRLALRESRYGLRRVGMYMASITLGVAALVAIHSFRADVSRSIREEAEELMGADARLESDRPFPDSIVSIVDSLRAAGQAVARVTTTSSMVLAPASNEVRLLQVRAVDAGYPFYGQPVTTPAEQWGTPLEAGELLVDPAVLIQLSVQVGDTLAVGAARFRIAATVADLPTDLGFQTALGPRVFLSQAALEQAGLLGVGSLARYEIFLHLPEADAPEVVEDRYRDVLRATDVDYDDAQEEARDLARGVRFLSRFLALVGLGALLLGGIGVASAVHVYVREKRPDIAVLRCIGASQATAFLAYLVQAGGLGLLGSAAGVVLGIGVQAALPLLLGDVLPVDVSTRISWSSSMAGLAIGVWVAVIFALIPLLEVREVPPLQALRQEVEGARRRLDVPRAAAYALLAGSVLLLCMLEAPDEEMGLVFAGGLAVALTGIALAGRGFMAMTRRFFPTSASYPVRQGVSNLFRPHNQTVAVTLALGFGAFVIGTVIEVEGNIRRDLSASFGTGQPNLLLFDVQPDQVDGVRQLLPPEARERADVTPLVTSRIASINGRTPEELRAGPNGPDEPERWALRREYRNTYRAEVGPAETLVAGRWWDGTPGSEDGTRIESGDLPRLSLEEDVAESLAVGLGDTITWSVSGLEIPSVVTSLRRVEWDRLEPNFFAIFEPGVLDGAPQMIVMIARVDDPAERAAVQRDLVGAFPNVSALDFTRVQEAIESVLSRVRQAVGFLGAFSALAGVLVLVGALASSRLQRLREGALLRTLGARRGQVLTVLLAEYLALGTLATASGLVLAVGAAALIMPSVFEMSYQPRVAALTVIWVGVVALTVLVGLAGSRELLRRPPLPVLREAPE